MSEIKKGDILVHLKNRTLPIIAIEYVMEWCVQCKKLDGSGSIVILKSDLHKDYQRYYGESSINQIIDYKEEARQAYRDQQSQDNEGDCGEPIGFVYGYVEACKKYKNELSQMKSEVEKLRECLKAVKETLGEIDNV